MAAGFVGFFPVTISGTSAGCTKAAVTGTVPLGFDLERSSGCVIQSGVVINHRHVIFHQDRG